AIILLYIGVMGFILWPEMKKLQVSTKLQKARSEARQLSSAVDQWAIENSIPEGTPYDWSQISDYVPTEILDKSAPSGPVDPLGNPYVFASTGLPVQVNPFSEE